MKGITYEVHVKSKFSRNKLKISKEHLQLLRVIKKSYRQLVTSKIAKCTSDDMDIGVIIWQKFTSKV